MDERPAVWIGHAVLHVSDLARSAEFWREIGTREIERSDDVAILELRGGTHLILVPGAEPDEAAPELPFDLMVDDLDTTHARWHAQGLDPTPIEHGGIHSAFSVRDPDGHLVTVNSSHVVGPV
jgi:catechol 2,3-dioxygenase-like lactoylglutathione lyase family enzyme